MQKVSDIFQYLDESEKVHERPRPQCEDLDVLLTQIEDFYISNRPLVDLYARFYVNKRQWDLWDLYKEKLAQWNSGQPSYEEQPTWSDDNIAHITTEYVMSLPKVKSAIESRQKLYAFEHNGVMCGITAEDQNGWAGVQLLLDKANKLGQPIKPFYFKNANGNECPIQDEADWDSFVLKGGMIRASKFQQPEGE